MRNEQLTFDTPESGRTLPIQGRPFALVMAELAKENNGFVRVVR
jgi:hypothetical protein